MATPASFVRVSPQRDLVVSCIVAALLVMSGDMNRAQTPVRVDRTGWTVTADSENPSPSHPARYAIDGNPATIWHTAWSTGVAPLPHTLTIDMHRDAEISGLGYLPRPSAGVNGRIGRIGRYEIRVSLNGADWSAPVAASTWADTGTEKIATFAPVLARFVQLKALSEAGNRGAWTSAAEVNLLAQTPTDPPDPPGTWTVTATCEETVLESGVIGNAFDDNPTTIWHTRYSGNPCQFPHHVTIDLGTQRPVSGLTYLPRQDGNSNGRIGTYGIDVGNDGASWINVAAGARAPR